jgi:hypothetical protein
LLKVKEENSNSEASGEGRGALPAEAGAGQPRLLSFTPRLSKILKKKNNINIKNIFHSQKLVLAIEYHPDNYIIQ